MQGSGRKIKIVEVSRLTTERYVNLFKMTYKDKEDQEKTWTYASRNDPPKADTGNFASPDAIIIVPFHEASGKLVIIKEFRIPLADYLYGFPAGLVDDGESVEDCAKREFEEETGMQLSRVIRTSPPIYSSSGLTDESIVMVYATCTGQASDGNTGSAEEIETIFVSPEEARALCARQEIRFDVKTWLVLYAFGIDGQL